MTTDAVILAAGRGTRLSTLGRSAPKGFLRVGEEPIIVESLARLFTAGIQSVTIVTGHLAEFYDELAARDKRISTVHNHQFANSGSMFSLFQLRNRVHRDFLLLESDLVYEQRALTLTQEFPNDSCLLVSGFTNSGDEVWVEANHGSLVALSKNREELGDVHGELVGITKVSTALFRRMCQIAEERFNESLQVEYESVLTSAAQKTPVPCLRIDDLVWAEIDTEGHLDRVRTGIYRELQERSKKDI